MKTIIMSTNLHKWVKTNDKPISRNNRIFDEYKCNICGISGNKYKNHPALFIRDNTDDELIYNCKKIKLKRTKKSILKRTKFKSI